MTPRHHLNGPESILVTSFFCGQFYAFGQNAPVSQLGALVLADERGAKHSPHLSALGNGIWHLTLDTWHLALGIWHLALGNGHLSLGTWHLARGTWAPEPSAHHLMNPNFMWNMTKISKTMICFDFFEKSQGASRSI